MSRISRYQQTIKKFIQTREIIEKTSDYTREILNNMLESHDYIPGILCLTILNNQCKKVKVHTDCLPNHRCYKN